MKDRSSIGVGHHYEIGELLQMLGETQSSCIFCLFLNAN